MQDLVVDVNTKARQVGESKNCVKYELQGDLKGMVYVPKNALPQPWPESINVSVFA